MCFNIDKCKVLKLGRNVNEGTYKLLYQNIPEGDCEKDIGNIVCKGVNPGNHALVLATGQIEC